MSIFIDKHELAEKKNIVNPNLLKGTANFSGDDWLYQNASLSKSVMAPNGNSTLEEGNWGQGYQNYFIKAGQFYTFSVDIKGTYAQLMIQTADGKDPTNIKGENVQRCYFQSDTWNRASMTIYCLESGTVRFFEAQGKEHNVANFKLEIGTVATPWCPAYADYAMKSDLDALKAEIDQLKQNK